MPTICFSRLPGWGGLGKLELRIALSTAEQLVSRTKMKKIIFNKWFFLFTVSIALFVLLAFLPQDWEVSSKDHLGYSCIQTINVINPALHSCLFWGSAIVAIVLFYFTVLYHRKKQIPYRIIFILLAIVIYPAACGRSVMSNLAPWTYHGVVVKDDKNTFYFYLQVHLCVTKERQADMNTGIVASNRRK